MIHSLVSDTPGLAVDADGIVWREIDEQTWGRGCVGTPSPVRSGAAGIAFQQRFVFLRPTWASAYEPLTLDAYRSAGLLPERSS